jgi:hypothetical protein
MKLTIRSWVTALVLVMPLSLIHASESHAASSLTYSALEQITNKATDEAHKDSFGELCTYGGHKSTTSLSLPPELYSGSEGDAWIYGEPFELSFYNWNFFYWDGTTWVDSSNDLWASYNLNRNGMLRVAQETAAGLVCKISNLTRTEAVGKDPAINHLGEVGDLFIKIDLKYRDAEFYYIWNGSKWVANLENPYTMAHAVATRTKTGEYCVYGKNKDVYSSYYSAPPTSYIGVKGDLWVVADKTTGRAMSQSYWDGKSWLKDGAPGSITLQNINDAVQYKARNSVTGEICYAGTNKSTQTFSSKLPMVYKGKVNDRWIVMYKDLTPTSYHYWNGKSWIVN